MPEDVRPAASPSRDAIRLVVGFLALRAVAAWFCPATVDEAYAIAVSRDWSLSYFDHPPACFSLARLMAWLTGSEHVFVARIPFLLAGAAASWLVYDIARIAYGPVAGLWALAWYSVAPFFLVSAGHFVVPDGPLDLALLVTLRLVLPDLLAPAATPRVGRWCAAGAAFALAFASKYQAVLFGASALAFLLASPPHRRLLRAPTTWVALAISTVGLGPALLWNASHGWASFGFQAGRAGTGSTGLHPVNFLRVLGGQMLYVLPGTWLLSLREAWAGVVRPRSIADRLFGWLTLVPPVVFLGVALVNERSLPHWAMSGFLFGFPLMGAWSERSLARHRRLLERTWAVTAAVLATAFLAYALEARHAVLARPFGAVAPAWGLDWQLQDWNGLAAAWPEFGTPSAVVVRNWTTGAKASHAIGPGVPIVPVDDARHFRFLPPAAAGGRVLAVEPTDVNGVDAALATFRAVLDDHGWRIVGEPRVVDERAGGQLRFHVLVVPVAPRD